MHIKSLVIYYSRTGNTREVARSISDALKCDNEEIRDNQNRSGPIGFLKSGFQAMRKSIVDIEELKNDPENYDLIVIGTPIWSGNVSSPIRSFIRFYSNSFKEVAFFCTANGNKMENVIKDMTTLCKKQPKATLLINAKEVKEMNYNVDKFITKLI